MARRKLDEMSYYEVLGVAPESSIDAIKHAFHSFARKYHPDRHHDEPELHSKSVRIYRRGTEAYRVLLNPEARRLYDQGLAEGRVRFDPSLVRQSLRPGAPSQRPQAHSARTRPLLLKAEQALKKGDYAQAELHLRIAVGHEPDNAELAEKLEEVRRAARGG
ncbi:MAG: DnaJ domain-containing protein [Myxococcales bacterium]|nr:DnaJ domain-containing protein [Myxococcales bacterium]